MNEELKMKNTPKFELGQICQKDFVSPYFGEVTDLPKGSNNNYYRVIYEDGDGEELTDREIQKFVDYYESQKIGKSMKKKNRIKSKYEIHIGTKMMKDFSKAYKAEVIKVPTVKNRPMAKYRIKFFADKTEEDVTAQELERLVKYYEQDHQGDIKNEELGLTSEENVDLDDLPLAKRLKLEEILGDDDGEDPSQQVMKRDCNEIKFKSEELVNDDSTVLRSNGNSNQDETQSETTDAIEDSSSLDDVQFLRDTSSGLSQIKQEMFHKATARRVSSNYEERQRRIRERLVALKSPSGEARKVFRRGNHKHSICTVLGGSLQAAPIVPRDKHPFIKKGEYYFAGHSDWNPWTPAYPGDVGFIESRWVKRIEVNGIDINNRFDKADVDRSKQECFHCFLQCAKKAYLPYYLGPNAANKRLYLGRYRVVPDDRDEVNVVQKVFMFEALDWDNKITLAEWHVLHEDPIIWHNTDKKNTDKKNTDKSPIVLTTDLAMDEYQQAAKIKAENEEEGLWRKLSLVKRQTRAFIEMLLGHKYQLEITPIEFVDYDEELYNKLVEIDAATGVVSMNEKELGPL